MTRSRSNPVLGAVTLAALLSLSAAASASPAAAKVGGISVRFAPEMLDNPADAAKVYDKLKLASRKACGLVGGWLNMNELTRANRCYSQTLADVVKRIDRPMLTSVHAANAGKVG